MIFFFFWSSNLIWLGNEFQVGNNFPSEFWRHLHCLIPSHPFENSEDILIPDSNVFWLSGILYLLYYEISWGYALAYIYFCVFSWISSGPPNLQNYIHQFWDLCSWIISLMVILVFLGHHDKIPQIVWFKQKFIFLQFSRLEIQDQGGRYQSGFLMRSLSGL